MDFQPVFEFHVARQARDYYDFDLEMFALNGNVVFANFRAVRDFAQRMNDKRDLVRFPERAVKASDINAMGLIDEILHMMVEQYETQTNPKTFERALQWLASEIGAEDLDKALARFTDLFPPLKVYQGDLSVVEYLAGETAGRPNREIALIEMVMLWLANQNPAMSPYLELFDDEALEKTTAYNQVFKSLKTYFDTQPKIENLNLVDALRAPALANPHSLTGQLEFLLQRWSGVLGGRLLFRILGGLDFIKEETRIVFGTGGGGGESMPVISFGGMEVEPENFTPDKDWMPSAVLIAKNTYVWLDQLSRQYRRPINRLDQIPDEELDRLRRMGFGGLWLIGLWERSNASQRIKQLCGNPEAVASAYSLYDYAIAYDLGGDEAYENLRQRAWQRGLRLAADMVPNHVGIYSKWVIEHPDWFISLDYSPFPSYSFNGPDLSEDGRVGIYLEDHYYSRSDAAVVFKRIDRWSGREQYIYHGNDGTSMPWNDTAQLNYLHPEVREAVIQTILHVARKFPIIRFDAAMTLAKKHFQRLWFPEPGSGGDIATRAEYGLTKDAFDAAMPVEFWREVVDRAAVEAPDTLLLAEAFWLMEGYFVRTLGMHRVYNSAFMNMLRDEKNAEYRLVIKNTLEFDPEILKRYVNFMNNPDERTAVDQFGKGDKYFGIVSMLATMPGLPMFGHGQLEGFTEKYGMEYRRAYWDEQVDTWLVERHEREISPLLHKRYLFAEVRDFLLYDFFTDQGFVNEDVYAYSNRSGEERGLVIYYNRYGETRGTIRTSAAYAVKAGDGDDKYLVQRSLGEGLGLIDDPNWYTIYKDQRSGLEYLRNNRELCERGLYLELGAYDYHVFVDFRQVPDNEQRQYAELASYLNGRGAPSIREAVQELFLQPVHTPFKELVNAGQFQWLIDNRLPEPDNAEQIAPEVKAAVLEEVEEKVSKLLVEIQSFSDGDGEPEGLVERITAELQAVLELPRLAAQLDGEHALADAGELINRKLSNGDQATWGALLGWLICGRMGEIMLPPDAGIEVPAVIWTAQAARQTQAWLDEWLLGKLVAATLRELGLNEERAWRAVGIIRLWVNHQDWFTQSEKDLLRPEIVLKSWLEDQRVQQFLMVNRYQGVLYYNKEAFEDLLWWAFAVSAVQIRADATLDDELRAAHLLACWQIVESLRKAEAASDYQLEKLIAAARKAAA